MLASLDPHSSYLDPDDFKDMQTQTSGEYGGLGIEVTAQDGFVKVVSPMDGTPASRAGIKSGDFLTAIDGKSIVGLPLNDAVKQMRGAVGSAITVTVVRENVEPFDVTLTREVIRPEVVKTKAIGDVGYVRITTFNEQTVKALDRGLEQVRKDVRGGLKGLVLDLRDNPGGLLEASIEVSSRFLNGGEVVSTRGRRESDAERYNAVRANRFPDVPIVVLVNGGSASAAEIVAGALQDRKRAVVMGVTSFGKGSVQTVLPLGPNKGAMRLTTSRYYTPSGRSIQGAGIEPDIEVAPVRLSDKDIADLKTRAARFSEVGSAERAGERPGRRAQAAARSGRHAAGRLHGRRLPARPGRRAASAPARPTRAPPPRRGRRAARRRRPRRKVRQSTLKRKGPASAGPFAFGLRNPRTCLARSANSPTFTGRFRRQIAAALFPRS